MAEKIRFYKLILLMPMSKGDGVELERVEEIFKAYDLNECLVQFGIKYQNSNSIKLLEAIPFEFIEDSKPAIGQKKEVHVKPNPVR